MRGRNRTKRGPSLYGHVIRLAVRRGVRNKTSSHRTPQGNNICACCNVTPGEAVKKKDGRDTVQLGKCNMLPVNTIPVAYVLR